MMMPGKQLGHPRYFFLTQIDLLVIMMAVFSLLYVLVWNPVLEEDVFRRTVFIVAILSSTVSFVFFTSVAKYDGLSDVINLLPFASAGLALSIVLQYICYVLFNDVTLSVTTQGYVVFMGVIEEVAFRGALFGTLFVVFVRSTGNSFLSFMISATVSSFIWTLYHLYVYSTKEWVLVAIFFVGIAYAYLYMKTRRLYVTMISHVMLNLIAIGLV